MSLMLDIANLSFHYRSRKDKVLKDINLRIQEGEIVGLLGPNGAGKTTLIKLIAGVYAPIEGCVRINEHDPYAEEEIRRKVGVMYQHPGFDQMLTGWDNLYIAGKFYGLSKRMVEDRVMELQGCFDTFDYFSRPVMALSGGETRRLQIVRALINNPSFILLDEPTVGLDVQGRRQFYAMLKDIIDKKGLSVIWTSHYLEEIEKNCERVVILNSGLIVADGAVQKVKGKTLVEEVKITLDPDSIKNGFQLIFEKFDVMETGSGEITYKGNTMEFYQNVLPELISLGLEPQNITANPSRLEDVYLDIVDHIKNKKVEE